VIETLTRFTLKIYAEPAPDFEPGVLIDVWQDWVRDHPLAETEIDVADYRHVHDGPWILLVNHEADYAYDGDDGKPGLVLQQRTPIQAPTLAARIEDAYRRLCRVAELTEQDVRVDGKLRFQRLPVRMQTNDRLRGPSDEATASALAEALGPFAANLDATAKALPLDHPGDRAAVWVA